MNSDRIRVLIVDDEPIARRGIRQFLQKHGDIEIAGEARNGKEAVRLIKALSPDLVFLDVQMPECDGFEVLRQIAPEHLPLVIFVTAYDNFAVRAFEAHALDYLVKPVTETRFQTSLLRVRQLLRSHEALELSRRLSSLLSQGKAATAIAPVRRLMIGAPGSDIIVDVDQIAWIEADDYYAAVHIGGKRHLVRESLASLEMRLERTQFVRTHRGTIVNLAHVTELRGDSFGQTTLVLRDGTRLAVSRRRRHDLEAYLRTFAG